MGVGRAVRAVVAGRDQAPVGEVKADAAEPAVRNRVHAALVGVHPVLACPVVKADVVRQLVRRVDRVVGIGPRPRRAAEGRPHRAVAGHKAAVGLALVGRKIPLVAGEDADVHEVAHRGVAAAEAIADKPNSH